MVLSMDLEFISRGSEALGTNPDPHEMSSLRSGADQQALGRGVGYHAGPIQFLAVISISGIGLSLSDDGIRLG